jgi:hypothetical protein
MEKWSTPRVMELQVGFTYGSTIPSINDDDTWVNGPDSAWSLWS